MNVPKRKKPEIIQNKAEWDALWPEVPYEGPRDKIRMEFTIAVPVNDIPKALEALGNCDIAGALQGKREEMNSGRWGGRPGAKRIIVATNWSLRKYEDWKCTYGTLEFETLPYEKWNIQTPQMVNMATYEFGKKGVVTEALRESGTLEGDVSNKIIFGSVDTRMWNEHSGIYMPKASEPENGIYLLRESDRYKSEEQDFADAVAAIPADEQSMEQ